MSCSGDLTFYFWWIIVLPLGHTSDRRGHRHLAGEKSAFYLFLFFFAFLWAPIFFSSYWLVCVGFVFCWSNLFCSFLKHFKCFWTEYFFSLNRTKNRLDVSAQFFRDGKLKHHRVRYSGLFAWAVVSFSFLLLSTCMGKKKSNLKKTAWHIYEKGRKKTRTAIFCEMSLIYVNKSWRCFQINLHFGQMSVIYVAHFKSSP